MDSTNKQRILSAAGILDLQEWVKEAAEESRPKVLKGPKTVHRYRSETMKDENGNDIKVRIKEEISRSALKGGSSNWKMVDAKATEVLGAKQKITIDPSERRAKAGKALGIAARQKAQEEADKFRDKIANCVSSILGSAPNTNPSIVPGFGITVQQGLDGRTTIGTIKTDAEEVEYVIVAGSVRWARSSWTGLASNYLKIPYDGVTAPSYVEKDDYDDFDWSLMPSDGGSDDRANAMYIDLSETPGPVFHVHRA